MIMMKVEQRTASGLIRAVRTIFCSVASPSHDTVSIQTLIHVVWTHCGAYITHKLSSNRLSTCIARPSVRRSVCLSVSQSTINCF